MKNTFYQILKVVRFTTKKVYNFALTLHLESPCIAFDIYIKASRHCELILEYIYIFRLMSKDH